MSEQEKIEMYSRIRDGILLAHKRMLIRKAKLGEPVVYADTEGKPYRVNAEEALRRFVEEHPSI